MSFLQWMGLGVTAAVLCMVVRAQHPQMAAVCAVAAGLMLAVSALDSLKGVESAFARLTALGGLKEGYLQMLVKVLGMSYASDLAAQLCQDLGENGLARKVEMAGRLAMFALTAPMLMTLLEMILELAP